MEKTIRVGMMPGRISEFAVTVGMTIGEVLEMAELSPNGYDVKVDGVKVEDFNTPITKNTNLVLLAKQVKGNSEKIIRVGMMPGRINEFAVTIGQSIAEVLEMADLNPSGYDVKVDGVKVDNLNTAITESTSLVLLAKQVKGN